MKISSYTIMQYYTIMVTLVIVTAAEAFSVHLVTILTDL